MSAHAIEQTVYPVLRGTYCLNVGLDARSWRGRNPFQA